MAKKYNLNWRTFSEHLKLTFKDLYQEGRYADITLVSDDQTQFKAHKIVLSACSPVFKKIIESNPSQHPLIYLRGIQSYEMESILQFMYLGQARFYNERMREFIKVAQDLEVKEISDGVELPIEKKDYTTEQKVHEEDFEEKETRISECGAEYNDGEAMLTDYRSEDEGVKYPCNQCDYQATRKSDLKRHIESKHEGIKYPCNQCDYQATQQGNLQTHIQSKHKGAKYSCNMCDYQATQQSHLKTHILSKHEGVTYPCDHCDYKATFQSSLKSHIRSKHGNMKYPCNQCDYQATRPDSLRTHIKSQHEGIKYPCIQCDYLAHTKSNLRRHIVSKHGNMFEFEC